MKGLKLLGLTTVAAAALLGSIAKAEEIKELKTEKGKAVALGNFLNTPAGCSSNAGPNPLPRLREKPSHGSVVMQIVVAEVPATDSCPARKIPVIALFYTPNADFIGMNTVQIEFETNDNKTPALSFRITVQDAG